MEDNFIIYTTLNLTKIGLTCLNLVSLPKGVDPIITTSFHSALHSLGGIQTFFPLFSQLDVPQILAEKRETAVDHSLRFGSGLHLLCITTSACKVSLSCHF